MNDPNSPADRLLASLQERAKELNCLYEIEELLNQSDLPPELMFPGVLRVLCPGWQYPDLCRAQIVYEGRVYKSHEFRPTPWMLSAEITVQGQVAGTLSVYYTEEMPRADEGPFLRDEVRLIRTVAERLAHYLLYQRLRHMRQEWQAARGEDGKVGERSAWQAPIQLLLKSDLNLYQRLARKMLNYLVRMGVREARVLLQGGDSGEDSGVFGERNTPGLKRTMDSAVLLSERPFAIAAQHMSDDEILAKAQRWIQEEKASQFIKVMENVRSSLREVSDAVRRFQHVITDGAELPQNIINGTRVSLIRRFLTEQLETIVVAKEFIEPGDFADVFDRMILPGDSLGRLGGKGSGLFIARCILERCRSAERPIGDIRVPRTWYVASDGLIDFIGHNDLEDVLEQKYKEIDQVRQEYPNLVQLFKNSVFPAEVVKGLSLALDDLGDRPLIVRSSSLLEDRLGTAFSGKYMSLFLANQGTKQQRLNALKDAIAEVYASTFGPDPIEYRRERGLLDFYEEMGLLIQEVVGTRVGRYFLPAFAGVAFSRNEFRWSPRIQRQDGLIRLVPGLGTRAVDRVSDDYPILTVPGQPNLRVNVTLDEVVRYSPRKVDVINLETATVETHDLAAFVREVGTEYPGFEQVFSVLRGDLFERPTRLMTDPEKDTLVANFEGLIRSSPFVSQLGNVLKILEESLGTPVDIEFAHDGKELYLLQCRPQSFAGEDAPAPIPKDAPKSDIVFTSHQHISNGYVPDITHLVYVDPERYGELGSRNEMVAVGRAVGRLNKLLPRRQFILMGPGRWGSRGDIKLGVSVTYSDISNTAMLIEIARKLGSYLPDLSFGTHFFQDLVESRIRYLPLYPDDPGEVFNERLLTRSANLLGDMLPEYASLGDVLRVIDVPACCEGRVLRVLMNADLNEALGLLVSPDERTGQAEPSATSQRKVPDEFWRWRLQMAEKIASEIDPARFGVVAAYLIGSTKNASAGPGSDIDLLIHIRASEEQQRDLQAWLEGWSLCLGQMNYLRTGYPSTGLLDVHLVTDEDIARKTSFAVKIGAVTDPARPLPLREGGAS